MCVKEEQRANREAVETGRKAGRDKGKQETGRGPGGRQRGQMWTVGRGCQEMGRR